MGDEELAEAVALSAKSAGSSLTTPGICPSWRKIICWHSLACFSATSLGVRSYFWANAAATPTASPHIDPVERTLVEAKARYEVLMGRPAISKLFTFLE